MFSNVFIFWPFISTQNKCYQLRQTKSESIEWQKARTLCQKDLGDLASFRTAEETQVLEYLYAKNFAGTIALTGLMYKPETAPSYYK